MTYLRSLLLVGLAACSTASADAKQPTPLEVQLALGKQLYVAKCASCHGNAGEGKRGAPPVVGKAAFPLEPRPKAKRDVKFHTAADVFAWATKHMPPKQPGKPPVVLTTDEYLAIFAFDLTANGVKLDKPLDGAAAAKIVLHE